MRADVRHHAGMVRQFVFGYGSLAAEIGSHHGREPCDEGFIADLPGFHRGWGVAMDNRRDLPGYKYYTAADGSRPGVFVSFLDVAAAGVQSSVNGLCLPVDCAQLVRLDRRERNYVREDVTDRVPAGATGGADGVQIWAYVGRDDARDRLAAARRAGIAVIDAGYLRVVEAAFAALGSDELARCRASLEPGELPVVELTRHELA